jgi:preprotein translocase subunit SecB
MDNLIKAAFTFQDYKLNTFEFKIPEDDSIEIGVAIYPTGNFYSKENKFEMNLEILVVDDKQQDNFIVKANMLATFIFNDLSSLKDIPPYFYQNSIAIVFPYIRSFISNLSLQANWEPLILPLLNLTGLEEFLSNNTKEIL